MRDTTVILNDIDKLVRSEGYIYSLCMLILENFHFEIEHLYDVEYNDLIGIQEISLLIGFLLHEPINFDHPKKPTDLIDLKKRSISLIKELEESLLAANRKTYKSSLDEEEKEKKTFNLFVKDGSIIEPIIYSGNGTYLYQYSKLLENRFKEDADWLKENCGFTIHEALELIQHIQKGLHKKFRRFYSFMLKNKERRSRWFNTPVKDNQLPIAFYPYMDLFSDVRDKEVRPELDDISEENWNHFYQNLINLFILNKEEMSLGDSKVLDAFLDKFTTDQKNEYNEQFTQVGDFNYFSGQPILLMKPNKYFFPISFMLYEALYKSPFYWMIADKEYSDTHIEHCCKFGQEMSYKLFATTWGKPSLYENVKVEDALGRTSTIDLLYILGNKALTVQTNSRDLTQLSRRSNDPEIFNHFKTALQDIYEDGLIQRDLLLSPNSKIELADGTPIELEQPLDEVYLLGVSMRNYPALAHQAHRLLTRNKNNPYPIFITVFELDILLHYMRNPYDFFYYMRQRTRLADHLIATEELAYLGYHLCNRLHPIEGKEMVHIEDKYSSYIDRNFYPHRFEVDHFLDNERDPIENRWKNKWFKRIYKQIRESDKSNRVDLAYKLLDLNPESIDRLIRQIQRMKEDIKESPKSLNATAYVKQQKVGISLLALPEKSDGNLPEMLNAYTTAEKYRNKADFWVGLGFRANSEKPFDFYIYLDFPWRRDKETQRLARKRRF